MSNTRKVVVIGAGVSGLTSALYLLKSKKSYEVTIVAQHIPGDIDIEYTSIFAGANWGSFADDHEIFLQDLDKPGYHYFMDLARTEPGAGVHIVPKQRYNRQSEMGKDGKPHDPWFIREKFVEGVRTLRKDELPESVGEDAKDPFVAGYEYQTITISTNIYLHYLLQQIFALGGVLKRKTIKHIDEAYNLHQSGERADLIVNCSGLLASKLGGVQDPEVHPIRGQILWARNSASKQISLKIPGFKDESVYIFPRKEGGCIIGGTFMPNNWSDVVDPGLAKRMIERAKKYLPELVDPNYEGNSTEIDVYRYNVGLRPGRTSGPKIEREGDIIHNYGIAGAGYQASIGLAEYVCQFAEEFYQQKSRGGNKL
ncbi:hypothetical protein WICPIJ_009259 [Wickerhamomyces pijperi]|uniref:FAD dependent oxidoreductase domain-containing protein n=1 Tax=Wickerhamomyces pijperi TaxID=599730 RepID=A0A9P8PPF3_WICPI|nr:hypothetical protein WICPIJ_009259 [Wickerhamomyces pijperi]